MNRKLFTRVTAIVLALIMLGSVFAVCFQVFAAGPMGTAIVNTGDDNTKNMIVVVAIVALVIVVALVVLPAVLKRRK